MRRDLRILLGLGLTFLGWSIALALIAHAHRTRADGALTTFPATALAGKHGG